MKKILIILAVIICVLIINKKEDIVIIPESSIRFRVIANSNSKKDQDNKNIISKNLANYLNDLLKNSKTKEEAYQIINKNYNNINNYVDNLMNLNNIDEEYKISIGKNYFPRKNYKGVLYNSGLYDSIVVSLGKSNGENWWCCMYPPLCLIPENINNVEYTTLIKEIINKLNVN